MFKYLCVLFLGDCLKSTLRRVTQSSRAGNECRRNEGELIVHNLT
jgi:hypothetical protein